MTYDRCDGRFVRRLSKRLMVEDSNDVARYVCAQIFPRLEEYVQEEMWALLLNCRQQVTHDVLVSRGSLDGTLAHPAIVYREAIRLGAARIILAHNHPSGDPTPSLADMQMTARLRKAGDLLEVPLLDHVIFAQDAWYSLAEHNWGEE